MITQHNIFMRFAASTKRT